MDHNVIGPDTGWTKPARRAPMANEMTATPARELPDFPCVMQDVHGNTHTCNDMNAFDAFRQSGMTVVEPPKPKKKATKKKAAAKKAK